MCSIETQKLTTEQVISRFRSRHGDRYDYSEVVYHLDGVPVTIICNNHGRFEQRPDLHWKGANCPRCAWLERDRGRIERAAAAFESRARATHGDRYDYTEARFKGARENLMVVCRKHGPFEQTASAHIRGAGCPHCANESKNQDKREACRDAFVERARMVHGDRYDYSLAKYKTVHSAVQIGCSIHGFFRQSPGSHLRGTGCPRCANNIRGAKKSAAARDRFLEKARAIHGDRYDYTLAAYNRTHENVTIICPDHGPFQQSPDNHLRGPNGCPICAQMVRVEKRRMPQEEFIARSVETHGGKYDYSEVAYRAWNHAVIILCPKHGKFRQTPNAHLAGKGCATCNESTGERQIEQYLNQAKVGFRRQHVIVPGPHPFRYDFFVPSANLLIEFHGGQHYEVSEFFGGEKAFKRTVERDRKKDALARQRGFRLLVIPHFRFGKLAEILDDALTNGSPSLVKERS
jgi:very-short-patch-repair endonuclease